MHFWGIRSCSFLKPVIGVDMVITAELYDRDVIIAFKETITAGQKAEVSSRTDQKDWKRVGSRRQEEGKKNQNRIQRVQRNGKNGGERTSIN